MVGADDAEFAANILRARAAAIGPPLPRAVSRSTLLLKLTNFLSGMDGVRPALCEYIVARLNDGLTRRGFPATVTGWLRTQRRTATYFKRLAGEGFVWADDGTRDSAWDALQRYGADAYAPDRKEALALINGIAAAPAYALDAHRRLREMLATANCVAALSMQAAALAPGFDRRRGRQCKFSVGGTAGWLSNIFST